MQDIYDAIIIGAGPAGMMAAITAARRGKKILLFEKMPGAGRKLLISGKGRCNLTNTSSADKFLERFSPSGVFLRNGFARFFNDDLCRFFEEAGCKLKAERGGRVFPASDKSADILDALKKRLEENDVRIKYNEEAQDILIGNNIKRVVTKTHKEYFAHKIAICAGGLSYPGTGSCGFGFEIARKLGHTIIAPKPGLAPIITKSALPSRLAGLSLENVKCSIICNGRITDSRFGEMLFTHFGLSGPVILDLSGSIYDLMEQGSLAPPKAGLGTNFAKQNLQVFISVNLKPALDRKKLDARLQREFLAHPAGAIKNVFKALLPMKLAPEFLKYCGLDEAKRANQVTKKEREKITDNLFDFRFEISGTKPIKDAIITRGGVSTNQINPKTMESKIIKGLYFAGEVIDVDAKTGGYNMQAAFSTGYVCGENI